MVVQFVRDIRRLDPGIGGAKLHYMYRERFGADYEYMVGRDKMEAIIARNNLNVRIPRRRPRTTDSRHGLPTYPNLVKDIIPIRKNQLWVTDITYIPIWHSDGSYTFCYLSMITDCYTKEIVSWYVGETMEAWCSVECLLKALETLDPDKIVNLIHHSDRGIQYVSAAYTSLLINAGIRISMTETGDPKDNAVAERQNSTIKNELLKDIKFYSIGEVRRAMGKAVAFYNNERPHMSLNNMTPRQAASCMGKIQKKWVSYREKYLENLEIQEGACTFAPQTLNMIERLSAGPIQEKRGLRENHSARLCRFACRRTFSREVQPKNQGIKNSVFWFFGSLVFILYFFGPWATYLRSHHHPGIRRRLRRLRRSHQAFRRPGNLRLGSHRLRRHDYLGRHDRHGCSAADRPILDRHCCQRG